MSTAAIALPRVHTGRPRRPKTPAPHWREVLRWSLEWPTPDWPREDERVVWGWWVRVG